MERWVELSVWGEDEPHPAATDDGRRRIRDQLEHWDERQDRRRVEDRMRDELHDSRATTVPMIAEKGN
jgi:hypothetical protein